MQIHRLFEIVHLLLNKKTVTAAELAERFEVSKRTILRDIEALSQAGIPVYTSQGRNGGISILDHYVLNKALISDEEQSEILFALQSLKAPDYTNSKACEDTLEKLKAVFDKEEADWIEVDFSRWGNSEPDKKKFELLKQAMIRRRAISFSYASSYGEISERTVHPLKLVFKSNAWYLQAFCLRKKDYRTFKVHRLWGVKVLQDTFAGKQYAPPRIEYPPPPAARLVPLTLQFSRGMAFRIYEEFDPGDVSENADGSFTVTTALPEDSWLYGYLLSFGPSVWVAAPSHVREKLLVQAEEILKKNSKF